MRFRRKWESWAVVTDGLKTYSERRLGRHWSERAAKRWALGICRGVNAKTPGPIRARAEVRQRKF